MKYLFFQFVSAITLLSLFGACSTNDNSDLPQNLEQLKLKGTWDVTRFIETENCENFNELSSFSSNTLDSWEIDDEGNYIHTFDDDGTIKTGTGKWIFIEKMSNVYTFQFTSEFTSIEENSLYYFIFNSDLIENYDLECIQDQGRNYLEGVEWQRQ